MADPTQPEPSSGDEAARDPDPGREFDRWPGTPEENHRLLVDLDTRWRDRLVHRESCPLRRDRIVDLASTRLLKRLRQGSPPSHPRAWFARVVWHLLKSDEIPRSPFEELLEETAVEFFFPEDQREREAAQEEAAEQAAALRAWLREERPALRKLLTDKQLRILRAALAHDTLKAAARALRMNPSNFRRDLEHLARRLRSGIRGQT